MDYHELMAQLVRRKALIVHCSGFKAGEPDYRLFPADMRQAMNDFNTAEKDHSCSVIWPGHVETFGELGIVVKPRGLESILGVCTQDGGTTRDVNTGRLTGFTVPFSIEMFEKTFEEASSGHNEWVIFDADMVGVFVRYRSRRPNVDKRVLISDPCISIYNEASEVLSMPVEFSDIEAAFPGMPILTIEYGEIVDLAGAVISPYA